MTYTELVARITTATNQPPEIVREVLAAFPDGITALNYGEMVRTPLGVFRMTTRGIRSVRAPGQTGPHKTIPPVMVAKLRSGLRLKREVPKKEG